MGSAYRGEGKTLHHIPAADVANNAVVVLGAATPVILAVAAAAIAAGEEGAVDIDGIFECPKVSGAVFKQGETLQWDVSAGAFDDNQAVAAAGDVQDGAIAAKDGANGETTCLVLLRAIPGTLT